MGNFLTLVIAIIGAKLGFHWALVLPVSIILGIIFDSLLVKDEDSIEESEVD